MHMLYSYDTSRVACCYDDHEMYVVNVYLYRNGHGFTKKRFKETYFMPSMPVFKTIWIRNNCDFVLSSGSYGNAVVAGFL
jgi:hypothetical protein